MTFRSLAEVGMGIAQRGWDFAQTASDFGASLPRDIRLECLLAAVAMRLDRLVELQQRTAGPMYSPTAMSPARRETSDRDPVADGLLRSYCRSLGGLSDKAIADCDLSRLSVRARKTVRRSGASMLSELTRTAMMALKHCGTTTADEIVAWARQQMGVADATSASAATRDIYEARATEAGRAADLVAAHLLPPTP